MVKLAWFALLAAPNEQLDAALPDGLAAARSLDELAPQNPVMALALGRNGKRRHRLGRSRSSTMPASRLDGWPKPADRLWPPVNSQLTIRPSARVLP